MQSRAGNQFRSRHTKIMRRRSVILIVVVALLAPKSSTGILAQDHCGAFRVPYSFLNPEAARQQLLGRTCTGRQISRAQRTIACEKLAEDIKHDGAEFRTADDQLLILLEKDADFFFEFFQSRSPLFESWLRGVETSAFVAPYLYNDTRKMEERRRCLIELLKETTVQTKEEEFMRDRIIQHLTSIKVRAVD
jgi:hypothetical protein